LSLGGVYTQGLSAAFEAAIDKQTWLEFCQNSASPLV
jgi:hypothetical protein